MTDLRSSRAGQTPLDPSEIEGLVPSSIATQAELDVAEQEAIALALPWALGRRRAPTGVLTQPFLKQLHARMFKGVWSWAGEYRRSARNLGVDWRTIPEAVEILLGDTRNWLEREVFPPDECCVRFHHRLVAIHPFPNGNGRHARLSADVLLVGLDAPRLTWGAGLQVSQAEIRNVYLNALRSADNGDPSALLAFARS